MERLGVERQRRERGEAHHPLHDAQRPERLAPAVGAASHPERAQREAEDERREHQLEGMRGAAEHEREHSEPGDLVDERGHGRPEAHTQQEQQELPLPQRRGVGGSNRRSLLRPRLGRRSSQRLALGDQPAPQRGNQV